MAIDGYNLAYSLGKCIYLFLHMPVGVALLVASSQQEVDNTIKMDSCIMIQTIGKQGGALLFITCYVIALMSSSGDIDIYMNMVKIAAARVMYKRHTRNRCSLSTGIELLL